MKGKRRILLAANFGLLLLIVGLIWAWQPQKAEAACGASTSSCTTCHEEKGELSVATKGDWHTQHSFGDFCQACHLGEATTEDKAQAHAGIIAKPLEKSEETCASCHPSDTAARLAKYSGNGVSLAATSSGSTAGAVSNKRAENPNFNVPWLNGAIGVLNVILLVVL